jgi:hypothetical protein
MAALCFCTLVLSAQTTWTGTTDNDWSTASNWSNGIPATGNDATIPLGSMAALTLTANTVFDYDINNQGELTIDLAGFNLNNNGLFLNDASVEISGSGTFSNLNNVTNNGDFIVNSIFTNSFSGTLINMGTMNLNSTVINFSDIENLGELNLNGDLDNGGTINNRPTGTLTNNANLDNLGGFVINNEGTIINALNWSNFGEFNNSDTLQNLSIFLNDGAGVLNNVSTGIVLNENRFTNQNTISNEGSFVNTSCNTFIGQDGSTTTNVGAGVFTNSGILYQLGTATVNITTGTGIVLTEANEIAEPNMVCFSNITVDLDADGLYSLTLNEVDNGSTVGYCTIASRILSQSNFTCENIGDNTVTLTITDGLGTPNTCQTIVNVRDNTPPTLSCPSDILINLNPGDCNEAISYDVLSEDNCVFTLVQSDDSGFTSGDVFPAGTTVQTYKAEDGNFDVTCSFSVTINGLPANQAMFCNNQLNVSLDENCHYTFTPNVMLSGPQVCDAIYTIEINDVPQTAIDETYIGQNLMVSVIHIETGNSCWGNALIEDKLAPEIHDCNDFISNCLENTDPISEGGIVPEPTYEDCSEYYSFYIDEVIQGTCEDTYSSIINRTWTVTDIFGFSNTCLQVITVERITLSNSTPACPADFIVECILGEEMDFSPENTGYPSLTYNGTTYALDEDSDDACDIAVNYSDNEMNVCNGSRKTMRTWSIYNWCEPLGPGNPFTCTQVIEITDNTAPVVMTPTNFTVSVGDDCQAIFEIPPAEYEDCSNEITWNTLTSLGIIEGNGGTVPSPGFSIGTETIFYIATDDCGNTSMDSIEVTITDELVPIAVCHFDVQVMLSGGTAEVTANMINNGSTDNCCLESILIARMDDNCGNPDDLLFGESIGVCCEDVGQETLVVLEVMDCYGNENFCMVPVVVGDNDMPTIECPLDLTLECDEDINDLGLMTGEAIGNDDCGETTISYEDEGTVTCEGGLTIRTFTTTDDFGNSASCIQMITVLGTEPVTQAHITCPADYDAVGCTPNVESTITGEPTFDLPACAQVSVDYSDVILPGTGDYCMKITRTWVITDVCYFDGNPANGGYFECIQSIFIGNSEAPTLNCPTASMPICSDNGSCEASNVDLSIEISDDCTPEEDLQIFWIVDIFNDDVEDIGLAASGIGQNTTNTYPVGSHEITYTVKDACGNSTSCSFPFLISDCGNPSPVCPNAINIELAADATVTLNASQINMSSTTDVCSDNTYLTTSFSIDIDDTSRTYSCANVGPANILTIYVTDPEGNQGSCTTTIEVQDNMNICPSNLMIAGAVATEQGEMVEQVMVEVEGIEMIETSTDEVGHYEYENGAFGQDYSLTPQSADDWGNGITTWDIIPIRKHILNTEPLNSPYQLIAADVNNSGTVTTADAIILRSFILQLTTEFPNNTSWRYVDADYAFPEPTNPWLETFPEEVNLQTLSEDAMQNNFIAVKIGDMNGTASTNGLIGENSDERSSDNFNLRITDRDLIANEEFTIEIFPEDLEKIYAYQMTFDFDANELEFISLEQGEGHQRSNFGLRLLDEGAITCSWDKTLLNTLNTNGPLFSVKFRARNATVLSKVLNVSSRFTQALAYTENGEAMNIQLNFIDENGQDMVADNFALYQNRPNPFRETTQIGFNLPMESEVSLKVFDAAGKLVKSINQNAIAGYNQITLMSADLPVHGVLYYELVTPTHKATKKMILTK